VVLPAARRAILRTVSRANVELVRETVRRFTPGDLDSWAELWHPDTRLYPPEGWPEPGPFLGLEAVRAQFELAFGDVWTGFHIGDVEVVGDAGDWVVLTYRLHGRGVSSGLDAEFDVAAAYRIEGGLINELHVRWTAGDALEAAGLPTTGDG
jgi:ketosteroid isomerase-like protein